MYVLILYLRYLPHIILKINKHLALAAFNDSRSRRMIITLPPTFSGIASWPGCPGPFSGERSQSPGWAETWDEENSFNGHLRQTNILSSHEGVKTSPQLFKLEECWRFPDKQLGLAKGDILDQFSVLEKHPGPLLGVGPVEVWPGELGDHLVTPEHNIFKRVINRRNNLMQFNNGQTVENRDGASENCSLKYSDCWPGAIGALCLCQDALCWHYGDPWPDMTWWLTSRTLEISSIPVCRQTRLSSLSHSPTSPDRRPKWALFIVWMWSELNLILWF